MKFIYLIFLKFFMIFQKTAMNVAIENENIDIIKLILYNKNFDINIPSVLINLNFIEF